MKRTIFSLLAFFAVATAHAGSFGGPPPFTNGSPLVSGVDGSYQATCRGQGSLMGIIRFSYNKGQQTASTVGNNWVFFLDGQIVKGTPTVAISSNRISGVLDTSAQTTTNSNGFISLPVVMLNVNGGSLGEFSGMMQGNGNFYGTGSLMPAPGVTNQVIGVYQNGVTGAINVVTGAINVSSANYTTGAGVVPPFSFKFNGVRTSLTGTNY